jgi:Asp-tRNA(Asn)/Glu-tRNA(Gln) amidotransferase A subunit family amidase
LKKSIETRFYLCRYFVDEFEMNKIMTKHKSEEIFRKAIEVIAEERRKFLMVTAATATAAVTGGASRMPYALQKKGNDGVGTWLDAMLHETTIRRLHSAIVAGELTSVQAARWYLERINTHDQQGVTLNAFVTLNPAAEDEARARDQELKAGEAPGLLHGIPIVIKDNIDVAGLPTTGGCKALRKLVPQGDATVVRHLRNAGAVILGKTNMSELAWGCDDTIGSALPGFTRNPYDTVYTCGGSSGGTAVAVSANLATAGIGTDTTCSVRAPASINALVGLRPTFGLISCSGVMPLTTEWDTIGPLTRSVEDAAILLKAMVGYNNSNPPTGAVSKTSQPFDVDALLPDAESFRLGVPRELVCEDGTDAEVLEMFDKAMQVLRSVGTVVKDPVSGPALPSFDSTIWYRRFRHDFDNYLASHGSSSPHASLTSVLESGQIHPWYETKLWELNEIDETPGENPYRKDMNLVKAKLQAQLLKRLNNNGLDALVFPTFCYPPKRNGDMLGPSDDNNGLAACAGFPALSIPMGFTKRGLPLGLQLLGRPQSEQRLLQIASTFEALTRHRYPPPI